MEILYLLLPMSVVLALLVIAVFAWAIRGGQFDDLGREGERILDSDQQSPGVHAPLIDGDQAPPEGGSRQSAHQQPGMATKGAFDGR
jgi:cbb3-type cytochrome oxidase maturation protein